MSCPPQSPPSHASDGTSVFLRRVIDVARHPLSLAREAHAPRGRLRRHEGDGPPWQRHERLAGRARDVVAIWTWSGRGFIKSGRRLHDGSRNAFLRQTKRTRQTRWTEWTGLLTTIGTRTNPTGPLSLLNPLSPPSPVRRVHSANASHSTQRAAEGPIDGASSSRSGRTAADERSIAVDRLILHCKSCSAL